MRHQRTNRKLGMKTAHRLSMLRNMATSLVIHERLRTTETRAKEVRRVVEKMITLGKQGDLAARRRAARVIRGNAAVQKLFGEIAPRYTERAGGYTRMIKIGHRNGDNAPMVIIELVESELPKRQKRKKKPEQAAAPAAAAPKAEEAVEEKAEATAASDEPAAEEAAPAPEGEEAK